MASKLALAALLLVVPGLSFGQSAITVDNISKPLGNDRWEWTVFVKGDAKTISQISCVQYELHPTFPNRFRRVCDRGSAPDQAFPLTANGWGTFDIPVTVFFVDGRSENLKPYALRFDATQPSGPPGCNKVNSFELKERAIQPIGGDLPGIYLYGEEIHSKHASHFYLLKSPDTIQAGSFNWARDTKHVKRVAALSTADNNAYARFSALTNKAIPLPVSGSKTTFYFTDSQRHNSVNVLVCK